jgi:hypothetical protein
MPWGFVYIFDNFGLCSSTTFNAGALASVEIKKYLLRAWLKIMA